MQFVQKSPVILPRPDTGSQYEYWALNLSDTRPPWREIVATTAMIHNSAENLREAGPKSVVQCIAIYVDAHGILFVAKTKKMQSMSNAKSGIGNLLGNIDNNYQQLAQSKLHPLDEYDRFHIQQWQTVEVIREEWEECFTDSDRPLALMDSNQSLALMGEVADDDFSIMRDVKQNLKFFATRHGTLQLISVGEWPDQLFRTACTHEPRRTLWLAEKLQEYRLEKPGIVEAVKEAVELHKEGHLPAPNRPSKHAFLERCKNALKQVHADAEVDLKKLPANIQQKVQRLMNLEGPRWQLAEACECGSTEWEVDEVRNRVASLFNKIASDRRWAEVQQSCVQCGRPWPMLHTPSQACYRGGVPVYTGIPTPNSLESLSSNTSNTLEMMSWQLN